MNIVVIGVGYVGLITGLGLSKLNHKVHFLDIDSEKINKLKKSTAPFYEPELENYLNNEGLKNSIDFTDNYELVNWKKTDIIMICVQTPSLENDEINLSFLNDVFQEIEKHASNQSVICIKSTIHPNALKNVLDSTSFTEQQIVFNPEFLREGSAFNDFFNPDRIVIGSINESNSKKVAELYKGIDSDVLFTDPISSQLIKYLSNAYLPLRLSFVNEASQIIKELGGNLSQTLEGIGLDKRIGKEYFRPSPGWGGSCFPKDVSEVISISKSKNLDIPLISMIKESNEQHKIWFSKYIQKLQSENNYKNIVLIGLAFKENTDDLRHSPTIDLFKRLEKNNVCIFDVNFGEYNQLPISTNIPDNSIIVEMYPLSGNLQTRVADEVKELKNYEYIKFWE